MVIIQVAGGLGNQLQQYALYRQFINLETEAKLDISWFEQPEAVKKRNDRTVTLRNLELKQFEGLVYETCSLKEKVNLIGTDNLIGKFRRKLFPASIHWVKETEMYHPEILTFKHMYLSGYFACEKYYADILDDLRNEIQFPPSQNIHNIKMAEEIENRRSVSVHIRRGDYLRPENEALFGNICTDAYYEAAIKKIKEKEKKAHFYIFSDDTDYVMKKFTGLEYTVIDINHGKDSFYDMWLMSKCKHNICANSTFSFWGARLNSNKNKLMIRPTIHKNGQIYKKEEMQKLWPNWILISPKGEG